MTIGEKIREYRKKAGLTQEELARKLDITRSMIGQFERSDKPPKLETIARIANALGVDISDLLGGYASFDAPEAYEQEMQRRRDQPGVEIKITHSENGTASTENVTISKINKLLSNLNDDGVFEAHHQIELLSKIPDFKE